MSDILTLIRKQSLTRKLTAIALVLSLLVASVGIVLQSFIFISELGAELSARVDQAVQLSRSDLTTGLNTSNLSLVDQKVEGISLLSQVSRVELIAPGLEPIVFENPKASEFVQEGRYYSYVVDTTSGQAELNIVAHCDPYFNRSRLIIGLNFIVNVLVILTLIGGILFSIKRLVLDHLRQIAEFAKKMSVDNLSEPLTLSRMSYGDGQDELDHVISAIEQMRHQFIEDLDQRRAIELALVSEKEENLEAQKMIEDAKASDRAKSQFIATMSHEIRTPMNGVIGMIEMMRGTTLDKEQTHYIDVIARSSDALMGIINDILDYSKIEAGKMDLESIEFEVEELVSDCLQLFGATAQKRKLALMGNISVDTPKRLVGDPTRLRQVLVNLIGNAFKFTENGSIFIDVSVIPTRTPNGCTIHIAINDTGIGIDTDVQKAIFSAFKQADSTTTRRYGGTGLGLAICKQLVELMNGNIGVNSVINEGSTFWFTAGLAYPSKLSEQYLPSSSLALSTKTMLYLHQTDFIDNALLAHANNHNLAVEIYRTPEQALTHLKSEAGLKVDFIVLSYQLGEDNGLAVARKIRDINSHTETPIIMITDGQQSNFSENEIAAVSSLLKRPFCVSRVIDTLLNESSGVILNELTPTKIEHNKVQEPSTLSVLVAEDNIVNRMVIEGLLKKINITPDFGENGKETVEKYCQLEKRYDLVLMDCEMPEMDGFEATSEIRKWETNRGDVSVPIIALTAHVEAEHRNRAFRVGMNYYLSKPVTSEKISKALESVGLS